MKIDLWGGWGGGFPCNLYHRSLAFDRFDDKSIR